VTPETIHIRRLVQTEIGFVVIEVFPDRDLASVTSFDADGWQLRGEDSDYTLRDLTDSLVLVGVDESKAAVLAGEVVSRVNDLGGTT
jgi:hypothetical protein